MSEPNLRELGLTVLLAGLRPDFLQVSLSRSRLMISG